MADQSPHRSRPSRISAAEFQAMQGRQSPRRPLVNHRAWTAKVEKNNQPFKLKLPFLPPSVNKLFTTVRDPATGVIKRVLTSKARRIRRLVAALINRTLDPAKLYELHIDFHLACYTKKGGVRKVDLSNRVKFIEDCVCEALGIDDSHVFRIVLTKHHSDTEMTSLEVREREPLSDQEAA
jgi:Holliday junction resolvase RusA-like endonuclease